MRSAKLQKSLFSRGFYDVFHKVIVVTQLMDIVLCDKEAEKKLPYFQFRFQFSNFSHFDSIDLFGISGDNLK